MAESTKELTDEGAKVTTTVEGSDATAAAPAEPSGKRGYWIIHILAIKDEEKFFAHLTLANSKTKYGGKTRIFAPVKATLKGDPVAYCAVIDSRRSRLRLIGDDQRIMQRPGHCWAIPRWTCGQRVCHRAEALPEHKPGQGLDQPRHAVKKKIHGLRGSVDPTFLVSFDRPGRTSTSAREPPRHRRLRRAVGPGPPGRPRHAGSDATTRPQGAGEWPRERTSVDRTVARDRPAARSQPRAPGRCASTHVLLLVGAARGAPRPPAIRRASESSDCPGLVRAHEQLDDEASPGCGVPECDQNHKPLPMGRFAVVFQEEAPTICHVNINLLTRCNLAVSGRPATVRSSPGISSSGVRTARRARGRSSAGARHRIGRPPWPTRPEHICRWRGGAPRRRVHAPSGRPVRVRADILPTRLEGEEKLRVHERRFPAQRGDLGAILCARRASL